MRLAKQLRGHAHFFLVIVPLILLMTYPTIIHVFDTSRFWAPTLDKDIWQKFWDAWHFKQVLAGQTDLYHTNMFFYPDGVYFPYRTYNLPHMILMNFLQLFMPASNAYCLTYLLIIFCCCLSAYIYCNWLFKDKWLALLGAVVFGLSQQVTGTAATPDLGFIASIPLTLYFLHRGIDEGKAKLLAMAGIMLGSTAWFGMYVFACNALTVGLFVLPFARSKWKDKTFWRGLALLGFLAFVVSAGRLLPILGDRADLDRAIQSRSGTELSSDLLGYVANFRHPVLTPFFNAATGAEIPAPQRTILIRSQALRAYAGITTLLLTGVGLASQLNRRRMLPSLLIAGVFLTLRLGPVLKINGVIYADILLPKHYLNQLLPTAFATFHHPSYFQIGILLPLAALACYGLGATLTCISSKRRAPMTLCLIAIIAYETWWLPYAKEVDQGIFKYSDWLAEQDNQASIALVALPMDIGIYGVNQFHLLHQTVHGYPIASGQVSRLPPTAFRYIDANSVLSAARAGKGIVCGVSQRHEMVAALDRLQTDGFSHVVLHKRMSGSAPFLASFADITPAYEDGYTSVYTIAQLRDYCDNPPPGTDSLALHLELVYGDVMPPLDVPVLTFHPAERINADALRYLSWNEGFGQNLNHVTLDDAGQLSLQGTNPEMRAVDDFVAKYDHSAILFIHAPEASEAPDAAWTDWLNRHYRLCQRLAQTDHIAIDHYLRLGMPCELVTAASPLHATFDNGSELRNRVVEMDGGELHVSLWWKVARFPKTSYSIQLFDDSGERARQIDHVMSAPVETRAIDLWDLPAGEYHARLIVYDFQTGASHGGEVMADGTRFQRDIEIARFIWDI